MPATHPSSSSVPTYQTSQDQLLPTVIPVNGTVYAWGRNSYGQLGDNTGVDKSTPTPANVLASGVTAITEGNSHSLAIQNGAAFAWGGNAGGQLGIGSFNSVTVPTQVPNMGSGVTAVAATGVSSVIVQNGMAFSCGQNDSGLLGIGNSNSSFKSSSLVAVNAPLTSDVTAVAGGDYHYLAIKNGSVYAWGFNGYGQLGDGTQNDRSTPVQVGIGSGVTAITGGRGFSLAILNGAAYSWGSNVFGFLGYGSHDGAAHRVPAMIPSLSTGVTAIAAGGNHCLAIKDGHVYAWGDNTFGQIGNGTITEVDTPTMIDPDHLNNIIAIAAGASDSYALASDGSLWVWGDGGYGQLGNGGSGNYYYKTTPQHVLPPANSYYSGLFRGGCTAAHALAILFVPPSSFFDGEIYLGNGRFYLPASSNPIASPFGYYTFLSDPHYFQHDDLGLEYAIDANNGRNGVYFYDFASSTFFYTATDFPFPYMSDFTLNSILYYYPDTNNPGHSTTNPRYFYNFATSQIITK